MFFPPSLDCLCSSLYPLVVICSGTCLDSNGNVTTVSGSFKKLDLCARHNLQPRDLRKIDSRLPTVLPTILVRPGSILVNILHIRSLITRDSVWLFPSPETTHSSVLYSVFMYNLQGALRLGRTSPQPYEFRALEAMLSSVSSALESELSNAHKMIDDLLNSLERSIQADKLNILLHYSRKLSALEKRVRLVQAAIDEVLENNDDLDAMYLTHARTQQNDHTEVEILLESFSKQIEEIVNEVEHVNTNIHQTQEIIELILDSSRNSLLALDLQVSIATMGIATGTLIAGFFGMNLHTGFETDPHAFWYTSALCGLLSVAMAGVALKRLRGIRSVGLSTGAYVTRGGELAGGSSALIRQQQSQLNQQFGGLSSSRIHHHHPRSSQSQPSPASPSPQQHSS